MANKDRKSQTHNNRTKISICVENEILEFFKKRAEKPDAAPYQTQINNELRKIMEREKKKIEFQVKSSEDQEIDFKKEILRDKSFLIELKDTLENI